MTTEEKIKKIAKYYGYEAQSRQCVEECAELIQAINKVWRKSLGCGLVTLEEVLREEKNDIKFSDEKECKDLVEELADVQIMIWQMKHLLAVRSVVLDEVIERKLDRQIGRIDNET